MLLAVSLLLPFAVRAADAPLKSIVMLDFELIDPTLDRASDEAQRERLKKISSLLRQQFIDKGFYRVLDTAPQQAMVDDLKSRFKLYDCNGCEIDIGRALGADRVMTAWVQKVSNLRSLRGRRIGGCNARENGPVWHHRLRPGDHPGLVDATKPPSFFARFASKPSAAQAPSPGVMLKTAASGAGFLSITR
jgi:hypothetical protein